MDKDNLKRIFPFLNVEYRKLTFKDLKSKLVFIELFGEKEPIDLEKLKVIYEFQKEELQK